MNPRQFCRERGYTSAIALTYSFDPLFFERVVLSDLWYGGAGDVVVVADQRQADEAVARCIGQVRHLGRRYHLGYASATVFHPKVILRIGPEGALLWIGTGNLTHGGWGGNRELAVSLTLEASDPSSAPTVRGIIRQALRYCTGSVPQEAIARIGDQTWLASADLRSESSFPLLLTAEDRALADDLKARWGDRQFKTMQVFTGSTDEGGRFLEWCHRQFGVEHCIVAVNPQTASFKPELLSRLPFQVSIAPTPTSPHMHAKFFWFEGPDGCAAIVGSANCSAAAWLLPLAQGGNAESVFVFDQAKASDFTQVLDRFPSEHLHPSQVPGLGVFAESKSREVEPAPYTLADLTLYAGLGEIRARVVPDLPAGSPAVLRVDDDEIPLRPTDEDKSLWIGSPPEERRAYGTQFGVVTIQIGDDSFTTPPRWIDHHDELRHAARERRIAQTLRNLSSGASGSERSLLLEDIEIVTKSLFGEPGAFPDPPRKRPEKEEPAPSDVPRVKPGDLVRSLAEMEEHRAAWLLARDVEPQLTLHGVMRALFATEDESDETAAADEPEHEVGEAGQLKQVAKQADMKKAAHTAVSEHSIPSEAQRRRFKKQVDELQSNVGTDKFAQRCTATQLVQAVAFPLACAALGQSSHWLTAEEARLWVTRAIDVLFRVGLNAGQHHGLLQAVRVRYESEDRSQTFDQVVGDGTLWLALIVALDRVEWTSDGGPMERALALREVVYSEQLIANTDTGRLGALVPRLHLVAESHTILRQAAATTGIMAEIEAFLEKWFDFLLEKQQGNEHCVGDLVWRKSGWGVVRTGAPITKTAKLEVYWRSQGTEVRMVASGYFVNFRWASKHYRDLVQLMKRLRSV